MVSAIFLLRNHDAQGSRRYALIKRYSVGMSECRESSQSRFIVWHRNWEFERGFPAGWFASIAVCPDACILKPLFCRVVSEISHVGLQSNSCSIRMQKHLREHQGFGDVSFVCQVVSDGCHVCLQQHHLRNQQDFLGISLCESKRSLLSTSPTTWPKGPQPEEHLLLHTAEFMHKPGFLTDYNRLNRICGPKTYLLGCHAFMAIFEFICHGVWMQQCLSWRWVCNIPSLKPTFLGGSPFKYLSEKPGFWAMQTFGHPLRKYRFLTSPCSPM